MVVLLVQTDFAAVAYITGSERRPELRFSVASPGRKENERELDLGFCRA